ncbi:hypothetical protein K432DRAFT_139920 [Lepidopterella palustris CBS 459.81]|uniref:Uncharacterized protein n=1 Tax=Lepidopterella palustris CBS 459.81 TaxID=1314670 RepID=A0A8E2EHN3_9PEZI|nr:hypothetical protein K432DRAFT_139920 [Lepidopterella palustris CBS 459.81]
MRENYSGRMLFAFFLPNLILQGGIVRYCLSFNSSFLFVLLREREAELRVVGSYAFSSNLQYHAVYFLISHHFSF